MTRLSDAAAGSESSMASLSWHSESKFNSHQSDSASPSLAPSQQARPGLTQLAAADRRPPPESDSAELSGLKKPAAQRVTSAA